MLGFFYLEFKKFNLGLINVIDTLLAIIAKRSPRIHVNNQYHLNKYFPSWTFYKSVNIVKFKFILQIAICLYFASFFSGQNMLHRMLFVYILLNFFCLLPE